MNINKKMRAFTALMVVSFASFARCAEAPIARARSYTTVAVGSAALIGLIGVIYETILSTKNGDSGIVQTIANAFLQTAPAFVSLQKDIREVVQNKSEEEKAQAVIALKGLVTLLESPGDLHKLLTQSSSTGVVTALNYAPTANFVSKIQAIVQNNFYKPIDGEVQLRQDGYVFYDIIRQMLVRVFSDLLPEYADNLSGALNLQLAPTAINGSAMQSIAPSAPEVKKLATTKDPQKMLYRAIMNDSAEDVQDAVNAGADIKGVKYRTIKDDKSPIVLAVLLAHSHAVRALLELGANPGGGYGGPSLVFMDGCQGAICAQYNFHPLVHHALLLGDLKSAASLVKYGAPFDGSLSFSHELYVVEQAISFFDHDPEACLEFIQELINRGYNINTTEPKKSPWHFAILLGGSNTSANPVDTTLIFELLIKNKANINQPLSGAPLFCAPLSLAIDSINKKAVKFLIELGADVDQRCNHRVPLSHAIDRCHDARNNPELAAEAQEILTLVKCHDGKTTVACCR